MENRFVKPLQALGLYCLFLKILFSILEPVFVVAYSWQSKHNTVLPKFIKDRNSSLIRLTPRRNSTYCHIKIKSLQNKFINQIKYACIPRSEEEFELEIDEFAALKTFSIDNISPKLRRRRRMKNVLSSCTNFISSLHFRRCCQCAITAASVDYSGIRINFKSSKTKSQSFLVASIRRRTTVDGLEILARPVSNAFI